MYVTTRGNHDHMVQLQDSIHYFSLTDHNG